MQYDIPTLGLVMSLVGFLLVVVLLVQYASGKTYPGIGLWVLGLLSTAVGMLLLQFRMLIDFRLVTIILANLFFVSGFAMVYGGMRVFCEQRQKK